MNASFKQRGCAYLIDIIILALLLTFVSLLMPPSENVKKLNSEYNEVADKYINNEIDFNTYYNRISYIYYDIDKENVIYGIINALFILIYFVFVPLYNDGKTLGKKIMKIKVVRKDGNQLEPNNLLFRNLILNGLGTMIISLALIYVTNATSYYMITSILGGIQLIISIINIILILRNKEALHDKLGNTKVICE